MVLHSSPWPWKDWTKVTLTKPHLQTQGPGPPPLVISYSCCLEHRTLSWNARGITQAINTGDWDLLREFSSRLNGTDFVNLGCNVPQALPSSKIPFIQNLRSGRNEQTNTHLGKLAMVLRKFQGSLWTTGEIREEGNGVKGLHLHYSWSCSRIRNYCLVRNAIYCD